MSEVLVAYKTKDWATFIKRFGTHFAHGMVVGSRAIHRISYDVKPSQLLSSLGVGI